LASGADRAVHNDEGHTAAYEARPQMDKAAETFFPARAIGPKRLERVIGLLG